MAMRTASPWWASLVFGVGLLFMLAGERFFGYLPGARMVLTGLGLVLLLAMTGLRGYTTMATTGARRRVERTLLLCQLGVLVAFLLYACTTKWGLAHLASTDKGAAKLDTMLTVVWALLLVASVVPMFMIEISLGLALRTHIEIASRSDEGIEYMRVADIGWSGLTIALAAGFLMVTCNVANERNVQKDVSYFKTSAPGDSTKGIASSSQDPIKVLLFFPDPNEVKEQVKDYFQALASATGKLQIEEHDRLVDAELAGKYKVTKDGMIVLVKGTGDKEKSATIELDTDIAKLRQAGNSKLRTFDREVNTQLLKLVREKRKAYLTINHGEASDPESIPSSIRPRVADRNMSLFKKRIAELGYEAKDLGFVDLSKDVPEDATIVIILAPTVPLQAPEWASIARYLDRGGRLLLALDPQFDTGLGELEGKLQVKLAKGVLTDDKAFMPLQHSPSDHRLVVTTQFSAHASVTSLRASRGLLLNITSATGAQGGAGALEDVPYTGKGEAPKKTITIHSMETSYLDVDDDGAFDPVKGERRQRWNLVAAVEGPKVKDKEGKDKDGFRAIVFADVDLFKDVALRADLGRQMMLMVAELGGGSVADDTLRWLGGEEAFTGEIVSEDDKPIQHTKNQDAVWFTLTIVGAPLIVLAIGLVGTWARRRRGKKTVEVKP
jgi:hypothetical protein